MSVQQEPISLQWQLAAPILGIFIVTLIFFINTLISNLNIALIINNIIVTSFASNMNCPLKPANPSIPNRKEQKERVTTQASNQK